MSFDQRTLSRTRRALVLLTTAIAVCGAGAALAAPESLKILVPAAPGGGWDQTGRALQAALQSGQDRQEGHRRQQGRRRRHDRPRAVRELEQGRPQRDDDGRHGDGRRDHHQQVAGQPVAGHADRAPDRRIPGRRRAGQLEDPVDEGSGRAVQGQPGQRRLGRRLGGRLGSHPGRHDRAGGRASNRRRSTTSPTPAAARRRPRSWAGTSRRASAAMASSPARSSRASCARSASRADKRVPGVDIPTLKEQGVDVEMVNWRAIFAAPGITDAQKKELIDVVDKTVKTRVVAGDAQAQRLDRHVPGRRPVQDVPRRRHSSASTRSSPVSA